MLLIVVITTIPSIQLQPFIDLLNLRLLFYIILPEKNFFCNTEKNYCKKKLLQKK